MNINFNRNAAVLACVLHADPSGLFAQAVNASSNSSGADPPGHGNIFLPNNNNNNKWTDDDGHGTSSSSSPAVPHIGCAKFLQTNHESQKLKAVNFRGTKDAAAAADDGEEQAEASVSANALRVSCSDGSASGYPCSNIDLMSFIPLEDLGVFLPDGVEGNDIWGWTHTPTGREFAIMGLTSGTTFVEITEPTNPKYVGFLGTYTVCSPWRDIKTYADHAFIVSEAAQHGMQIFDLTQLLTVEEVDMPVEFLETAHYAGFGNAHNIVINEDSGYAYGVGTNTFSGGLHIVDITDPINPVGAGGFSGDGYTHDAQCLIYNGPDSDYTGSEICFNYNEDTLTIVDVTVKTTPVELGRVGYSGSAYTHQGWLTDDGKHVVVNDEIDEGTSNPPTKTHVFNVENLDAPLYVGFHSGTTTARDHNLYIKGDLVFQANYRGGLQVLQIDDLTTASFNQVANFDIYPTSNNNDYNGAWSNYPYFPSGNIIVSGIEQGLFVLQSPNNFGLAGSVRKRKLTVDIDDIQQLEEEPTAEETRRSLQQAGCIVRDFEAAIPGSTDGWSTDGSCTTGTFVVGTPSQVLDSCVLTQPGGDHTTGSGQALYSAPNSSPGADDVDGGECNAISPIYSIVNDSILSVWYYYGHRTTGDDSGDYFELEMSIGGGSWASLSSIGDVKSRAIWREATASVPAGSDVRLRIRASDGPSVGDLVEAGIDDIVFCPTGSSAPTPIPVPTSAPTPGPTPEQTPGPTTGPTNPPVLKYICKKNDPGNPEICLNGSFLDTTCSADGVPCGNGGKVCNLASCPSSGPGPSPPATPPPSPPTPTFCPVCGNGQTCCPVDGNCQTSGKPNRRACV